MFTRIGRYTYRNAKLVLISVLLLVIVAGFMGFQSFGKLKSEGFDDPKSESSQAADLIKQHFDGQTNLILLVHAQQGLVDTPKVTQEAQSIASNLANQTDVKNVVDYWSSHNPVLKSKDGTDALIMAYFGGSPENAQKLINTFSRNDTTLSISAGGQAAVNAGVTHQVGKDLALAEGIAVPLTFVLLILAFGGLVAALLPVLMGLVAIIGTFAELFVIGSTTDVSIYAINLTTALGLGLAIDYALFIVSRYREELGAGKTTEEAITRSVETAGRTVIFSATTVAASLAALSIFPLYFLRSFAYAGIGVVAISALTALVILPALLTTLGKRVEAGRLPWIHVHKVEAPFWRKVASTVMRHPALTALPVLAVLLIAASPLRHITFGMPSDKVLSTQATARHADDVISSKFVSNQSSQINVVITGSPSTQQLTAYIRTISKLDNVADARTPLGTFSSGRLISPIPSQPATADVNSVVVDMNADVNGDSNNAQTLVKNIRSIRVDNEAQVYVGGQSAALVDAKHAIGSRLLPAGIIIVIATFLMLFLFTGSIIQPLRALILNSLTLSATIGVMVWIFQEGHFATPLHFTAVPTDMSMTMLLFCIAFGLSMDYEVFLMSRIKELHDAGARTEEAVGHGLARAGRIVSTAAAMLAVSFFAFGTAHISFLQLFGIGAGLAILIDATLIRGVLVPAFMRMLGEHAWYAPAFLKKVEKRYGLTDK